MATPLWLPTDRFRATYQSDIHLLLYMQIKAALKKRFPLFYRWLRSLVIKQWPSETSKCRPRLLQFCTGYGIDIGPGGDPISPSAIRVDLPTPYSDVGLMPVQLGGDATNLYWFNDNSLDYVYSSHVLEDFRDTETALREWLRVIKPKGHLVIFCPDEQVYRAHCDRTRQPYNTNHIHANFSLEFVKNILDKIHGSEVVYENPLVDVYSWDLVVRKL